MSKVFVKFSVTSDQEMKGEVVRGESDYYNLNKIVFLLGYKPEKASSWEGTLPKEQEIWLCDIHQESNREDPLKGALFVKLVERGSTLPATFKGIEVVFSADELNVHGDYATSQDRTPVFVTARGTSYISGTFARGAEITATPDQEKKIRESLESIYDYRRSVKHASPYPRGNDPMIPLVYNGMSPQAASVQLDEIRRVEREASNARWVESQKPLIGKTIWAGDLEQYARIGTLIGVGIDEKSRTNYHKVRLSGTGAEVTLLNVRRNYLLTSEVVTWIETVAEIALRHSIPESLLSGYDEFYGLPMETIFPKMPEFALHKGSTNYDRLESVKVTFGVDPEVRIKTHFMGIIVGGKCATKGKIRLDPSKLNPVGVGMSPKRVFPPKIMLVPANVVGPAIAWEEASVTFRVSGYQGGTETHSLAVVKTIGSVSVSPFTYQWRHYYPDIIPAENGAAEKAALKWAEDFRKEV